MYKNLCVSGGGISGIAVISSLKCLKNNKIFDNKKIKKYVGTSVGSIIIFILILNYDLDFIIEFFKTQKSILMKFDQIFIYSYWCRTGR